MLMENILDFTVRLKDGSSKRSVNVKEVYLTRHCDRDIEATGPCSPDAYKYNVGALKFLRKSKPRVADKTFLHGKDLRSQIKGNDFG